MGCPRKALPLRQESPRTGEARRSAPPLRPGRSRPLRPNPHSSCQACVLRIGSRFQVPGSRFQVPGTPSLVLKLETGNLSFSYPQKLLTLLDDAADDCRLARAALAAAGDVGRRRALRKGDEETAGGLRVAQEEEILVGDTGGDCRARVQVSHVEAGTVGSDAAAGQTPRRREERDLRDVELSRRAGGVHHVVGLAEEGAARHGGGG